MDEKDRQIIFDKFLKCYGDAGNEIYIRPKLIDEIQQANENDCFVFYKNKKAFVQINALELINILEGDL